MRGYRKTYQIYYAKCREWHLLGGNLQTFETLSEGHALEVAQEAMCREDVVGAMVVSCERALFCDLKTRKENSIDIITALTRLGNAPY